MVTDDATLVIELAGPTDWAGFRQACRVLLAEGVPPEQVRWRWGTADDHDAGDPVATPAAPAHADLFSANASASVTGRALTPRDLDRVPLRADQRPLRLSREQLRTLQGASLHRDAGRFELCHRWLHRTHADPRLRQDVLDADWRQLERMAHAVGRDIHKMHAFVRFRPTRRPGEPDLQVAWFEPAHHIVLAAAPFFVRRFANQRWSILTPDLCVAWDGEQLQTAPGARRADAPPADAGEALWLAYYASTFNPARLKDQAMRREMPRRYWANLPEAVLISTLVQQARARTGRMLNDAARDGPAP
ncbi:DNA metabolism protein [Ottowia sp. GY511]|uniref:TIGR03915 family putative DNA repair protein n=1 Tax=Ottowia flava TaxID=2675430 RepID=A0ABW4KUU0_9BURK|nr:TIGR03915 family putative DNA repair protein [Ottowia sp. GY511]TXK33450.1 DNA metabolism protein [Ottowia sp. GY511]